MKAAQKIQKIVRSTSTPQQAMTSTPKEKSEHSLFSDARTGCSPTGPDPENKVGDQDIGSPGTPVSSGLHMPGETGYCRERTR